MNSRLTYFLVLAEELNFSKAAKRLFVTQQCLSAYIKDLEKEFDTPLLIRKPTLRLTDAGDLLLQSFRQIQMLHMNLKKEMVDISSGQKRHLTVGMHPTRSEALLPSILKRYWEQYPQVTVDMVDGTTGEFETSLLDGKMDLYFGVNSLPHPLITHLPLVEERAFVIISDTLLKRSFPREYPACTKRFRQGVDLREFQHIPFILNHGKSRTTDVIFKYLAANGITLPIRCYSNNGTVRIELCAMSLGACIGSQSRMTAVVRYDGDKNGYSRLHVFPIKDLLITNSFSIACHAHIYQPQYLRFFVETATDVIRDIYGHDYSLSQSLLDADENDNA